MIYKLEDLNSMSAEQLANIARDLGIKKVDTSDDNLEQLKYDILDMQAEAVSSAAVERRQRASKKDGEAEAQPRKRGRKPKNNADNVSEDQNSDKTPNAKTSAEPDNTQASQTASSTSTAEDTTAEKPARKRGRKSNAQKAAEAAEAAKKAADQDTADKAQDAEAPSDDDKTVDNTAAVSDELPVNDGNETVATNNNQGQGQQRKNKNQQSQGQPMVFTPRNKNNDKESAAQASSLVSFFPGVQGRQFTPRGKDAQQPLPQEPAAEQPQEQPVQEATQPAPVMPRGPIVIGDPNQKLPNQQQGKGKKNKKNQQQQQQKEPQYSFDNILEATGVLEITPDNYGYLRSSDYNYMPSPDDVLLTAQQIKQYGLKTGDVVEAIVRPPRENEKYFVLTSVRFVNGRHPEYIRDRVNFEHLVPLFPNEKFDLANGRSANVSTRIVDLFSPIGKGQRGLIVAPPKTGKTMLLKDIANVIAENHPETYIMILLIDERPEEVTDMMRSVNAEVIASTFDESADHHVRIAGIVLEKAKRMVECGHDVVILLDSITRLARAYNTCAPASGKILSGGVDANALQKPKRFFGAARNIENGGSLTIIATALTETSSKMDEVIFEEFKGTGNMELQLDRKLSNKRIFPAVDIIASSTRRDDLLLTPDTQNRMWILRRFLGDRSSIEAMEFVRDRVQRTVSNEELLRTMND